VGKKVDVEKAHKVFGKTLKISKSKPFWQTVSELSSLDPWVLNTDPQLFR
jgi:hypothetical protein